MVAVVKVNAKKHLGDLVKERDSWKGRCQEMAKAIMSVLYVIEPEQPETTPTTAPLSFLDKSKNALRWLHSFVKESAEFTGAHVLSLVRAHYPRIDLQCLEARYP